MNIKSFQVCSNLALKKDDISCFKLAFKKTILSLKNQHQKKKSFVNKQCKKNRKDISFNKVGENIVELSRLIINQFTALQHLCQ